MALVSAPTAIPTRFDLTIEKPGEVVLRSIYTGAQQVIPRGTAIWAGSVSYGPYGTINERPDIGQIEAFISNLSGSENTAVFPLPYINQSDRYDVPLEAVASRRAGGRTEIELNHRADPINNRGLREGDRITIGGRLYQCGTNQVDNLVIITPTLDVALPLPVEFRNPTITIRGNNPNGVPLVSEPDFTGPWTVSFIEAR